MQTQTCRNNMLPQSGFRLLAGDSPRKTNSVSISGGYNNVRAGCTDATCDDIIRTFSNYLGAKIPCNFRAADQKIQLKAGAICLRLNGCVGCNKHVFMLNDLEEECPLCGHQRYNVKRKPNEVCIITHCMRIILCTILLF